MKIAYALTLGVFGGSLAAIPALAQPSYSVVAQYGTVGLYHPNGVIADPNSPVPGALIGGAAQDKTHPGYILMFVPASGGAYAPQVVHNFSGADGAWPQGRLLPFNGVLLGETYVGGANNEGVLFSLTPSGNSYTFQKLMDFGGTACAAYRAHGDLALGADGALYGSGGIDTNISPAGGTIYRIVPPTSGGAWTCSVIQTINVGSGPLRVAAAADGTLYYNVLSGGPNRFGYVAMLTPPAMAGGSWTQTIIHSFGSSKTDGQFPLSSLLPDGAGGYYSMTKNGGTFKSGTLFHFDAGGANFTIAYNFAGGATDAALPRDELVSYNGMLFGSSNTGGANNLGTVFSLAGSGTSWTSSVIHSFAGGKTDGNKGSHGLTLVNNTLFGTTELGGAKNTGVLFEVTSP